MVESMRESHWWTVCDQLRLQVWSDQAFARFVRLKQQKYDGKHIVLVTHSLCARIMLLSFLNSPVENIYRLNQGNTALNIVELRDYGPVVMKMNDTTHIINDEKIENSALE